MHDDPEDDQPTIHFGGEWVPAHEVWKKMETATVVADTIDRFNQDFPHLSTEETRSVVPLVRQRLKSIELRLPRKEYSSPDLAAFAAEILHERTPEEALDALNEQYGAELDLLQLVQLVGEAPYVAALAREAGEFADNKISPEQTARVWNETGRPSPGGGLWTAKKVAMILAGGA